MDLIKRITSFSISLIAIYALTFTSCSGKESDSIWGVAELSIGYGTGKNTKAFFKVVDVITDSEGSVKKGDVLIAYISAIELKANDVMERENVPIPVVFKAIRKSDGSVIIVNYYVRRSVR